MGIHFGNLGVRVSGLIYYSLSPHEQKALAGIFSKGFPNTVRRIRSNILTVVPPFVLGYVVYDWGVKYNAQLHRKNPLDYESDE